MVEIDSATIRDSLQEGTELHIELTGLAGLVKVVCRKALFINPGICWNMFGM